MNPFCLNYASPFSLKVSQNQGRWRASLPVSRSESPILILSLDEDRMASIFTPKFDGELARPPLRLVLWRTQRRTSIPHHLSLYHSYDGSIRVETIRTTFISQSKLHHVWELYRKNDVDKGQHFQREMRMPTAYKEFDLGEERTRTTGS